VASREQGELETGDDQTEINPYSTEAQAEADTFTSDILMSPHPPYETLSHLVY
jgi:hypothetical protein